MPSSVGAIPYRLRVGVTGHRALPDDPAFIARVRFALQRVRHMAPSSPATPLCMALVSPLAEGADRLMARMALDDQDAVLVVPLPLPVDDYMADFAAEDSKREFQGLLARAQEVVRLPRAETREEAYQNVADHLVERCDILIALWDGQPARGPGGTAEVVAMARARLLPLLWIDTRAPFALHEERGDGIARDSFHHLDLFNRGRFDAVRLNDDITRRMTALGAASARAGLDPAVTRPFAAWNLPYLARADLLALRHQAVFLRVSAAVFVLAAVSASIAAAQQLFFPRWPGVGWLEVILPLAAVFILLTNRRWRLHERWSAYRLLAEWLRARLFLAMVGVTEDGERGHPDSPSEGWLVRAFEEVWARRPRVEPTPDHVGPLREALLAAWIQDQIDYQHATNRRFAQRQRRATYAVVALFVATLLVAALHLLAESGFASIHVPPTGWTFLSTALPAAAGAVSGLAARREYERHAQRYGRMARDLEKVKRHLERAHDLAHLRVAARRAEALMLAENDDWSSITRFHDIDLTL